MTIRELIAKAGKLQTQIAEGKKASEELQKLTPTLKRVLAEHEGEVVELWIDGIWKGFQVVDGKLADYREPALLSLADLDKEIDAPVAPPLTQVA